MKKIILTVAIFFLFVNICNSCRLKEYQKIKIDYILQTKIFDKFDKKYLEILRNRLEKIDLKLENEIQIETLNYIKKRFGEEYFLREKIEFKIDEKLKNRNFKIPILMFHYIEKVSSDTKDKQRYFLSYSPEKLEKLLIYLKKNNIKTLTFWDLKNIIEGREKFSEKSIILTFDDGHFCHYTKAFKLLEKYGNLGVFFIISGKPDNDRNYMNWQQIKEISDSGHEVGSHSITHPYLTKLNFNEMKKEILNSKITIEKQIGKSVISFCYPYGDLDEKVKKVVSDNYLFGRTTRESEILNTNKLFLLPKIDVGPEFSLEKLKKFYK